MMKEESNFEYNLVDLGLPSGTLWMDRNIGASSPSDYGLYFAWGETDGYTADEVGSKKKFDWKDYKHTNESDNKLTKYCNKSNYGYDGYTDSLKELELTDDSAYKYTKGNCCMPTKKQLQELLDNTTSERTILDGINGRLFTSKINGNSIFVPAAGCGYDGYMDYSDCYCDLLSSSLCEDLPCHSWYLFFSSEFAVVHICNRCVGKSVRGVKSIIK